MGCDIHAFIEVPHYGMINSWASLPFLKRDYKLFSLLAGVRNHDNGLQPVVPPRGVPENMAWAAADLYNSDLYIWHTASWLQLHELRQVAKQYRTTEIANYPLQNHDLNAIIAAMAALDLSERGLSRLVFWFDN